MSGTLGVIYTIITVLIVIMVLLVGIVLFVYWQGKKNNGKQSQQSGSTKKQDKKLQGKMQGVESMSKFLDFDEIVDSMIVRKNRQQYIMVIHCKGVNYDLLGQEEKLAVENGFTQFLNTLRFPVQLYIQTRSLNLKDSIEQYEDRIRNVQEEILKLDAQIKKEKSNGRTDLVRRLEFDRRRKMNILEYGADITNYVARMSQNRNVLQQNTYVAVAYYTSEFGGEIANYSKEEVDNIAFSELYTRAQTLVRALAASGVTGRVINSEELAELLYIAYNRDDSELINIQRSVDAQYDSLYNIAQDVMDKQKQIIEEKVEKESIDLAANSITKADKLLKLKEEHKEEIRRRALSYVEQYKNEMTDELYKETKEQIEKAKIEENEDIKPKNSESEKTENIRHKKTIAEDNESVKTKKPLTKEEMLARKRALARKKARMAEIARRKEAQSNKTNSSNSESIRKTKKVYQQSGIEG